MSLRWDFSTVADHLEQALHAAEEELRLEQAVYGLDAKDERSLQALLAGRLAGRYEVAREVHYPSSKGRKLSHRQRCDLVLSPRGSPLRLDRSPPTLFDPPSLCEPGDCAVAGGEGGVSVSRRRRPAHPLRAQWRQAVVADLRKMEAEPLVREAGLVLVVFNESREVLEKDLELFEAVLAQKEVLAGFRHVRAVPILERNGHRLCSLAVWPTLQR